MDTKKGDRDAISIDASCGRGWLGPVDEAAAGTGVCGVYGVHRGAEASGRAARFESASAEFGCHDSAADEWQAAGAGWSVCGVERTDWRLLPDRCGGSGCGDFVGGAVPRVGSWDGGSTASMGDVRRSLGQRG